VKLEFFGGIQMSQTRPPLRRSRRNRVVAGVCGGLAEFFGISAFWFRLAFFIALIPGGIPGLVPYLILWIVIPKASE
jgi:phage shock protein C